MLSTECQFYFFPGVVMSQRLKFISCSKINQAENNIVKTIENTARAIYAHPINAHIHLRAKWRFLRGVSKLRLMFNFECVLHVHYGVQ